MDTYSWTGRDLDYSIGRAWNDDTGCKGSNDLYIYTIAYMEMGKIQTIFIC